MVEKPAGDEGHSRSTRSWTLSAVRASEAALASSAAGRGTTAGAARDRSRTSERSAPVTIPASCPSAPDGVLDGPGQTEPVRRREAGVAAPPLASDDGARNRE